MTTPHFFDAEAELAVLQNQADIARAQMALAAAHDKMVAQAVAWAFVAGAATGWIVARIFA